MPANRQQSMWLTVAFASVCVLSALAIVYTKHESRELFIELEALSDERDQLNIEWSQLQIEQSMWATHSRIEKIANDELELERPGSDDIYVIEQP
jgi:cell division protein FtsL